LKKENVKIGMKVVPHSKTVWSELEESNSWETALKRKQNYLYVTAWDDEEKCFVLSEDITDKEGGDFFNPEDFESYQEKETDANSLIINRKDLLYLLSMTYGYIDDELGGMEEENEHSLKLKSIIDKYNILMVDIKSI